MKSLLINGLKLNFLELNPEKENTILFIHGNSHSLSTFSKQMYDKKLNEFRLIFVDLPGHGESSKEGSYSLKSLSIAFAQFIKELELSNVIIAGHSLGGHVAINLLKHFTPKALFLFGTPPLDRPFNPEAFILNPKAAALNLAEPTQSEIESFMGEMNYTGRDLTAGVEDYLKTDPRFRLEILSDIIDGVHENEIELINSFQGDLLFLLATTERLINNNYIRDAVKNEKAVILEISAGHSPHVESPLDFNETLAKFSRRVFENNYSKVGNNQESISHEQRNQ